MYLRFFDNIQDPTVRAYVSTMARGSFLLPRIFKTYLVVGDYQVHGEGYLPNDFFLVQGQLKGTEDSQKEGDFFLSAGYNVGMVMNVARETYPDCRAIRFPWEYSHGNYCT